SSRGGRFSRRRGRCGLGLLGEARLRSENARKEEARSGETDQTGWHGESASRREQAPIKPWQSSATPGQVESSSRGAKRRGDPGAAGRPTFSGSPRPHFVRARDDGFG